MLSLGVFAGFLNINLGQPAIQASSCSNYPILEPGNVVLAKNTDFKDIEEGETVIYKAPSRSMIVAIKL